MLRERFFAQPVRATSAHSLVTIVFNISPLPLRLASVAIPLLFGFAAYRVHKVSANGAFVLAFCTTALSVQAMLTVTGIHDKVPILRGPWIEWREVIEYGASILLAFVSGNILAVLIFQVLPRVLAQGGKPNAFAFHVARLLGQHVGEEQLRLRARLIQDLMHTAGPLAGVAITAIGSIYAGLKGILHKDLLLWTTPPSTPAAATAGSARTRPAPCRRRGRARRRCVKPWCRSRARRKRPGFCGGAIRCEGPGVDGSGSARRSCTLQRWSEQPCVRPPCEERWTARQH